MCRWKPAQPDQPAEQRQPHPEEFADEGDRMMIRESDNLTIEEVAADLRCSKAHVYNLVNGKVKGTPRLPSIGFGRRKLVRRATLELWKTAIEQDLEINDMISPSGKSAVGAWKEEFHA